MAEITKTEISVEDFPIESLSGTVKRRARVYIRDAAITATETLDLATYIPGVADIEGIICETDDGVVSVASTWSTTTITFGATGVYEGCFVVTFN